MDDIAFELVDTYLVKAYRSATDMLAQDAAAFAIQEILAAKGCAGKGDTLNQEGKIFWNRFRSDIQTIIKAFRTTSYTLSTRVNTELKAAGSKTAPIFQGQVCDYSRTVCHHHLLLSHN